MMKQFALSITLLIGLGLAAAGHVHAQVTLDQPIGELSKQISDGLTENEKHTIAVVEFVDLEGRVTNFGRFVAEELITRLYRTKKFTVIERQLLNKVIIEQKLSLTGMIDQSSAQKLGKVLGVDAIASGTVTDLGKILRVNARLIDTSTGKIFAVASTDIAKDDSVLALMGKGQVAPDGTSRTPQSYQGHAIASKDIGSLRVVLKSVMPMKLQGGFLQSSNGIRCSFELSNLETQKPIVVAMNATPLNSTQLRGDLRSTLVDENGGLWRLRNSDVAGLGIVGVGMRASGDLYDPTEIVTLLSKRDDLNSDLDDRAGNRRFIFGSMTEISAGQSLTVSMTFAQVSQTTSGAPAKFFQIASEIVVGVATTGAKKSYSLRNLTFDRVSLSASARQLTPVGVSHPAGAEERLQLEVLES
jgi:TolB-like protein